MIDALDFATARDLIGGRAGVRDVPCPMCGPDRRSAINRRRPVLRIWATEPDFVSWHCARCGERGWAKDHGAQSARPQQLQQIRAEVAAREKIAAAKQLSKARWLWSRRLLPDGSPVDHYLRTARGYDGPLPATIGYLPPHGDHAPAMIAAFGMPAEPEPGVLAIDDPAVIGVHLTRLLPDGSGKAGSERAKIMIGRSIGSPIVLAPMNDLLGLAVTEGIEDAISIHAATGLGAWAAGSASRLPALADAVPDYTDRVNVICDDDQDGRRHAAAFADRLHARGLACDVAFLNSERAAA